MTVGQLIKDLQKYDKGLPVSALLQSDLPFTYEVTGAELQSAMDASRAFTGKEGEKPDRLYLLIKILPR